MVMPATRHSSRGGDKEMPGTTAELETLFIRKCQGLLRYGRQLENFVYKEMPGTTVRH